VRNELADRWILREVEHLSVRREHPLVIPDHRTRRRRHRRNALDLADTRCLRHVSAHKACPPSARRRGRLGARGSSIQS
jgi:hypothetical protein